MKTIAKKILRRLGIEVTHARRAATPRFVELPAPRQPGRGTVLIAYVVNPFRLPEGRELPSGHTHERY